MQRNEEALRDAKRCLNLEPTFIKAHYRKSQALQRLQKYEDATVAAKEGLKHHEGNPELQKLVKDIGELLMTYSCHIAIPFRDPSLL